MPREDYSMKAIWAALIAAISLASVSAVDAQTWPVKPLRAIIPVGAGSTIDIIPRVVFEQLLDCAVRPKNLGPNGGDQSRSVAHLQFSNHFDDGVEARGLRRPKIIKIGKPHRHVD